MYIDVGTMGEGGSKCKMQPLNWLNLISIYDTESLFTSDVLGDACQNTWHKLQDMYNTGTSYYHQQ